MRTDKDIEIMCSNIKTIREKCGYSHKEMANILDIPVLTLKKLEKGIITRRAKVDLIFHIEKHFGISPKTLFTKPIENAVFHHKAP